jgi:MFS transporter, ACS family, allantoate permease
MMGEKDAQEPQDLAITQQPTTPDYLDGQLKEIEGADPALEFAGDEVIEFTTEEEAGVLSKIDWHILPLLCWVYAIQFADKTTLNYASLMGITEDTHLNSSSQQYSWASSIFYAGYIFWESVDNQISWS